MTSQPATNRLECVTCVGATAPNYILRDLSPTSCGPGRYYDLSAFQGKVTLVVLLRSTCGYCQAQLSKLEEMRFELLTEGHEIWLVVINQVNTGDQIASLTSRSNAPMFQDVIEVNAWGAMSDLIITQDIEGNDVQRRIGGDKDDMYIYDETGQLARFLDDDDQTYPLNLNTDQGYANLKTALLGVLNAEIP